MPKPPPASPVATVLLGITALTIAVSGVLDWRSHKASMVGHRQAYEFQEHIGRALYLDEALTMSAFMFVATSDSRWRSRYRSLEAEFLGLQRSILARAARDPGLKPDIATFNSTSDSLFKLESTAFRLVEGGRRADAQAVLFGPAYEQQKALFAGSFRGIRTKLQERLLRDQQSSDRWADGIAISGTLFLILLAVAWGWVIRHLNQALARRGTAENDLERSNTELRVVVERLEARQSELRLIAELGEYLLMCKNVPEAVDVLSKRLPALFPESSGALYLVNASWDTAESAVRWRDPQSAEFFTPDECWAIKRGSPHRVALGESAVLCQHVPAAVDSAYSCLPLVAQGSALGVLHISANDRSVPEPLYQLAHTVADQVSFSLANLKLQESLHTQAIRDPLTGLFNRRFMEASLERELSRAARRNAPVSVVLMDVDHFKQFNDLFGHDGGDALLRELGRFLENQCRKGDVACRFGGEEFLLVLPDCAAENARAKAEELRHGVARLDIQRNRQALGKITISAGVATFPVHGMANEALIAAADAALYRAKARGRDCVVVADEGAVDRTP